MASISRHDAKSVVSIIKQFPPDIQKDRFYLSVQTAHTAQLGEAHEKEYIQLMQDFQKLYPDVVDIHLMTMDLAFLKKDYDSVIEKAEILFKHYQDPFQFLFQVSAYIELGKFELAKKAAQRAIDLDPEFLSAYYKMIDIALAEEDYESVLAWAEKINQKKLQLDLMTFFQNNLFAKFRESQVYKDWLAKQAKSEAAP